MVEEEHLDEMEQEVGADEAEAAGDLGEFDDLEEGEFGDLDAEALEKDLMALGEMFAEGDLMGGEQVDVRQSSVQFVTGGEVRMNQSAALNVTAESAEVKMSAVGMARGEDLTLDRTFSWAVVGNHVTTERGLAGVVLGRTLEGDVRALMDWRSALMFGVGLSLGFTAVRLVRNGLRALSGNR